MFFSRAGVSVRRLSIVSLRLLVRALVIFWALALRMISFCVFSLSAIFFSTRFFSRLESCVNLYEVCFAVMFICFSISLFFNG